MSPRTQFTRVAALVVALAITPALTGCFSNPLENLVRDNLGEAGIDIDAGGQGLPADFPNNVPLPDGNLTEGSKVSLGGIENWIVTIEVADLASTWASLETEYNSAGFEGNAGLVADSGAITTYTSDLYLVSLIGATNEGESPTIMITVSTAPQHSDDG